MLIKTTQIPYIVSKFEAHDKLKSLLLDTIATEKYRWDWGNEHRISRTDWNVPKEHIRTYWKILSPYMIPHMDKVMSAVGMENWEIDNFWFQQYKHNDTHIWHRHEKTLWSHVYYLEFPEGTPATKFRNEDIVPEVYEGCVLTFPSVFEHCSPPNMSDKVKTIIAFNTN